MKTAEVDQLAASEIAIQDISPETREYQRVFHVQVPDGNMRDVVYVQAPLGYFPSQEFLTKMTRVARDISDGKYGVTKDDIIELIANATRRSERRQSEPEIIEDALELVEDTADENVEKLKKLYEEYAVLIQGFLHLVEIVPGLQQDIFALSLGVRPRDREWFKEMISDTPRRGGPTVAEGKDIMRVFIRQNARLIRRFLEEDLRDLAEELMTALEDTKEETTETKMDTSSPGGRPSSTTPQDIPASV